MTWLPTFVVPFLAFGSPTSAPTIHPPHNFHSLASSAYIYFPYSLCMWNLIASIIFYHRTLTNSNALFHFRFFSWKQKELTVFCSTSYMYLNLGMFLRRAFHLHFISIYLSLYFFYKLLRTSFIVSAICSTACTCLGAMNNATRLCRSEQRFSQNGAAGADVTPNQQSKRDIMWWIFAGQQSRSH